MTFYAQKLGLDQITIYHSIMSLRRYRFERSPESYLFGAWIYCLKVRDEEAAELLKEIGGF